MIWFTKLTIAYLILKLKQAKRVVELPEPSICGSGIVPATYILKELNVEAPVLRKFWKITIESKDNIFKSCKSFLVIWLFVQKFLSYRLGQRIFTLGFDVKWGIDEVYSVCFNNSYRQRNAVNYNFFRQLIKFQVNYFEYSRFSGMDFLIMQVQLNSRFKALFIVKYFFSYKKIALCLGLKLGMD